MRQKGHAEFWLICNNRGVILVFSVVALIEHVILVRRPNRRVMWLFDGA
jgi:hypothetical protein